MASLYKIFIKFDRTSLILLSYPMNLFYHFIKISFDVLSCYLIHDCRFCVLSFFIWTNMYLVVTYFIKQMNKLDITICDM